MNPEQQARAKRYEAIHNWLFVGETLLTAALLVLAITTGLSAWLAAQARSVTGNPWLATALYAAVAIVAAKLVMLPVGWFAGYHLEHRFGLSNQSFAAWLWDETKSLGLSLVLGVIALDVIYFLLRRTGDWWWAATGGFFLLFGVVLSTLFPVVILPLFYKLRPLDNPTLTSRLAALAERVGAKLLGVYRMDMSAKTKKANAAFAGLGRTKRIILGDTLLDKFAEDEIEVVMAHEMAHYKHGDITKLIAWGTATTFAGLKVADVVLRWTVERLGFAGITDLGACPLLLLCLFLFGLVVMPLNNAFTRWREWKADAAALQLTGNRDGFVRAMRKLADQNLADLQPHPVIEFLLHDHPSLARRIAFAEQWQPA